VNEAHAADGRTKRNDLPLLHARRFLGEEKEMKPLQTGVALSVTVAVFYSLCTLVEVLWPAQFMGFMNALFHGMDFRALQTAELHPWRDYLYALAVMALWAFAIGAFFAFMHNALAHAPLHRRLRHA
jgi:ABC-type phosphate/phosphonate transport system permease subunit